MPARPAAHALLALSVLLGAATIPVNPTEAVADSLSVSLPRVQSPFAPSGTPDNSGAGTDGGWLDLSSSTVKAGLVVLGGLFIAALSFFVLYPMFLERARWWPLAAYGYSLAVVTIAVFALLLWQFWNELVLQPEEFGGMPWSHEWGLRLAVGVLGVLLVLGIVFGFRVRSRGRSASTSA